MDARNMVSRADVVNSIDTTPASYRRNDANLKDGWNRETCIREI